MSHSSGQQVLGTVLLTQLSVDSHLKELSSLAGLLYVGKTHVSHSLFTEAPHLRHFLLRIAESKLLNSVHCVVPASNTSLRLQEIAHIQAWAALITTTYNAKLNCSKSILFSLQKVNAARPQGKTLRPPPPILHIKRVNNLKSSIGVIINDQ